MKNIILCSIAVLLLTASGCRQVKKEQIVFPPDSAAVQTVGGYKKQQTETPEITISAVESSASSAESTVTTSQNKYYFNKNTKKFHKSDCRYAKNCGNDFVTDRNSLISDGYSPCKICNP